MESLTTYEKINTEELEGILENLETHFSVSAKSDFLPDRYRKECRILRNNIRKILKEIEKAKGE